MSSDAQGGGWQRLSAAWLAAWFRAYPHLILPLLDRLGLALSVLERRGGATYQAMAAAKLVRSRGEVRAACRMAENWNHRP